MHRLRPLGSKQHYIFLALILLANLFFFQNCENGSFDTPQVLNTDSLASQTPNNQEPQQKQCVHPDNGQAVAPGFAYYTFSISSAPTQGACDAAKQTSYCDANTGTFLPAPQTHKSCLVAGQTCAYTTGPGIANPTGNNEGSTVTGYAVNSATYPATCPQEVTRTCQSNGNWNGSTPLYANCAQKCVHPDSSQAVNTGTSYTYYTRQSGTQAECNAAKVTSTCSSSGQFSPAVGGTRYASCSVIAVKSAYSPILAVKADEKVGTVDEPQGDPNPVSVGYIDNGDSLTFRNIDFENGAKSVTLNIALVKESTFAPNSKVEIRQGSASGTIIGTFIPQETGSWTSFQDQAVNLTSTISGVKDITLAFVGDKGILNLKSLVFSKNTVVVPEPPPPPVDNTLINPNVRIIEFYGDSTTYGQLDPAYGGNIDTWQAPTPEPLAFQQALPKDRNWIVRNEGRSGTTATELLNGQDSASGRPAHPPWATQMERSDAEVVIINFAINDSWKPAGNRETLFRQSLTQLVQIAKSKGKFVILETPNIIEWNIQAYVQIIKDIAAANSLPVIDQYTYLNNHFNGNWQSCNYDKVHPRASTYVLKGQYSAQLFKAWIGLK